MDVLILGAGPAATGAALALTARPDVRVRILDVGGRLEDDHESARVTLAGQSPAQWSMDDLRLISATPVASEHRGLPEKRNYGSDFPFRDFGQLAGVTGDGRVNAHVISGAYGGFSNTWGAQTMAFSAASFDDWPFARHELEADYRAVLGAIPYTAEDDDLAEYFPLYGAADALPPLAANPARLLQGYERHRTALRARGILLGRARLAMRASQCVLCGLCMTGCPYSLVYSASHTLDALVARGRVKYVGGYLGLRVDEANGRPSVAARSLSTGRIETFYADKVLVACGALGTTRLVAHSLGLWHQPLHLHESAQFLLPLLTRRGAASLTQDGSFTLNQVNLLLPFDEAGHDLVQIHTYPYNVAMDDAVPSALKLPALRGVRDALLKRLIVGLGYLPSWRSPGFDVEVTPPLGESDAAGLALTSRPSSDGDAKALLRSVVSRLRRAAPYLGAAPVPSQVELADPGKSYHFGGSFPHARQRTDETSSDLIGRVGPWRNIHLVDASVFPTIPATTFTLTIMANAHRIAKTLVADPHDQ